jgi:peptidoglycan-associated lipoprotein
MTSAERARLSLLEQQYRDLRDSVSKASAMVPPPSSAAALATMQELIHFAYDKSDLTADSKATLDAKVPVFQANPQMRIIIVGNTDMRGTDRYNLGLGFRRASAAKDYLVSKGIDAVRIEVTSEGERKPIANGTSKSDMAQNRRDEFRLLVASDYLVPPPTP